MFYVDVAELHVLRNGIILELILSLKFILIIFLGSLIEDKFLGMKNLQTTVVSVCFVSTYSTTNWKFPCSKFLAGNYTCNMSNIFCAIVRYITVHTCTEIFSSKIEQKILCCLFFVAAGQWEKLCYLSFQCKVACVSFHFYHWVIKKHIIMEIISTPTMQLRTMKIFCKI